MLDVTVFRSDGTIRCRVPVSDGSAAYYTVMSEDYITIKFQMDKRIAFQIGDYIDVDEKQTHHLLQKSLPTKFGKLTTEYVFDARMRELLAPRYVLVESPKPTYSVSLRAWSYELKLGAYYYGWENRLVKMPYYKNDGTTVRKECEFSLTDQMTQHVFIVLLNLKLCGFTNPRTGGAINAKIRYNDTKQIEVSVTDDDTISTKETTYSSSTNDEEYITLSTQEVTYSGNNVIEVLNSIADAWECEWWVIGGTIYFGRLGGGNTSDATEVSLNTELSEISSDDSSGEFATRLFAYGGTKNVPGSYRKQLIFDVSETDRESAYSGTTYLNVTDDSRLLQSNWFKNQEYFAVTSQEMTGADTSTQAVFDNAKSSTGTGYALVWDDCVSGTFNAIYLGYSATEHGTLLYKDVKNTVEYELQVPTVPYKVNQFSLSSDFRLHVIALGKIPDHVTLELFNDRDSLGTFTFKRAQSGWTVYNVLQCTAAGSEEGYVVEAYKMYKIDFTPTDAIVDYILKNSFEFGQEMSFKIYTDSTLIVAYASGKIEYFNSYTMASFSVNFVDRLNSDGQRETHPLSGQDLDAWINLGYGTWSDVDSKQICIRDEYKGQVQKGDRYVISTSDIMRNKVRESYYTSIDDSAAVNSTCENRLLLPEGTEFVDAVDNLTANNIIEAEKVFDDVYPHRVDTITEIDNSKVYYEETTDATTGETYQDPWNAYRFKCEKGSADFSKDYIISGEKLHIVFSSGMLNGMDFEVSYNPDGHAEKKADGTRVDEATWFEIIRNEDYGTGLPNETLYPKVGDEFTLYGYDTSYVSDSLVGEAEEDLRVRAKAYIEKLIHNDGTRTVTMLPSWLNKYNLWFALGDKLKFDTGAYFDAVREQRIIGYEISMDAPIDSPKFTCGESPRYSRLKTIENSIKKLN